MVNYYLLCSRRSNYYTRVMRVESEGELTDATLLGTPAWALKQRHKGMPATYSGTFHCESIG